MSRKGREVGEQEKGEVPLRSECLTRDLICETLSINLTLSFKQNHNGKV